MPQMLRCTCVLIVRIPFQMPSFMKEIILVLNFPYLHFLFNLQRFNFVSHNLYSLELQNKFYFSSYSSFNTKKKNKTISILIKVWEPCMILFAILFNFQKTIWVIENNRKWMFTITTFLIKTSGHPVQVPRWDAPNWLLLLIMLLKVVPRSKNYTSSSSKWKRFLPRSFHHSPRSST